MINLHLPHECKKFIKYVQQRADEHDVIFHINVFDPFVVTGGVKVNGYFCDQDLQLAVGMGDRPLEQWFATFVHESCHMDQWIEDAPVWTNYCIDEEGEVDAGILWDYWIKGYVELTQDQLHRYIQRTFDVERDCEVRAIQRIHEWNLPLDPVAYTQRANAYLYFYKAICVTRKWYTIGKEPYNIKAILDKMPTEYVIDWDEELTDELLEEYKKIL